MFLDSSGTLKLLLLPLTVERNPNVTVERTLIVQKTTGSSNVKFEGREDLGSSESYSWQEGQPWQFTKFGSSQSYGKQKCPFWQLTGCVSSESYCWHLQQLTANKSLKILQQSYCAAALIHELSTITSLYQVDQSIYK